ncbi:MAG: YciI family protein [Tumebacillaceae bacterium]
MAHFAAILHMKQPELNLEYRPHHLEYLEGLEQQGKIFARGPFVDGSGGMVVYIAESMEEAVQLAKQDPYVANGVRELELHEWKI